MRFVNVDTDASVYQGQLYLTEKEARQFLVDLESLLSDPEAKDHRHLFSEDDYCEISFSIVTPTKIREGYTEREQLLITKNK